MAGPPRTDLRQYEELRPFTVEYDIATEATSSVILTQGKTKVSVSVYGPSQPRYLRHEEYDKCTVDVEYKANFTSSNTNRSIIENDGIVMVKKMLENVLLLEQFPRMMIMVKVNILQDGGSLRSVVLNACTLAFSKSGIPMSCMPVSVSCVQTRDKHVLLDPVSSEEESSLTVSKYDFTFAPDCNSVSNSSSTGLFSVGDMRVALNVCSAASVNVDKVMKNYVMENM